MRKCKNRNRWLSSHALALCGVSKPPVNEECSINKDYFLIVGLDTSPKTKARLLDQRVFHKIGESLCLKQLIWLKN